MKKTFRQLAVLKDIYPMTGNRIRFRNGLQGQESSDCV